MRFIFQILYIWKPHMNYFSHSNPLFSTFFVRVQRRTLRLPTPATHKAQCNYSQVLKLLSVWHLEKRLRSEKSFLHRELCKHPPPLFSLSCSHLTSIPPILSSVHPQYSSTSPLTQGIGIKCLEKQSQHSIISWEFAHARDSVSIRYRISALFFKEVPMLHAPMLILPISFLSVSHTRWHCRQAIFTQSSALM